MKIRYKSLFVTAICCGAISTLASRAKADVPLLPPDCGRAAELYGIVPNVTFGFAPPEVQDWWIQRNCNAPSPSGTVSQCQNMSDLYGVVAWQTFGGAPAAAQTWWTAQGCDTYPLCQNMSDLYGITANVTWGIASALPYVQYAWISEGCQTTPRVDTKDLCSFAMSKFFIAPNVSFGFAPNDVRTWWTSTGCNPPAPLPPN